MERDAPVWLLRAEGAAEAALGIVGFAMTGQSWWLFAALGLAPDLSFAAYLAGPRVGAIGYNLVHTTALPALLAAAALAMSSPVALAVAAVWLAHIGIDRALGYGLKTGEGFTYTHLGRIGPATRN